MVRRRLQLLLVEDNPSDVELLRFALRPARRPCDLVHRSTLREALPIAAEGSFDCALVDLSLPDATALEAVNRLHDVAPRLPIVVLTGLADDETCARALRAGAQDYLIKDHLEPQLVLRAIEHAIERQRLLVHIETAATQARQQDEMTRALLESLGDGIVVVDAGGSVRLANGAAKRLLGAALEHPLTLPSHSTDHLVRRPDGSLRRIAIDSKRTVWHGQDARIITLRDVTDALRARELEQRLTQADRLAALGRLAGGIAHEVNNPAALLAANCEYLRHELRGGAEFDLEQAHGLLQDCQDAIGRITAITKDLRACAHVGDDEVELVDLVDVVQAAHTLLRSQLNLGPWVRRDLQAVPPIAGHRGKLIQVVTVLLTNAVQALPPDGKGRISLSTRLERGHAVLAVEDTGSGIPEELKDRLFDPFFTRPAGEGGGPLGLAMAAEIIRVHRGEIRVHSLGGHGSRFEVRLPIEHGLTLPLRSGEPRPLAPGPRRRRLLLVDDEPAFLRAMARLLGRQYEVVTATGGAEALDRLPRTFDVVVCDLMMPEVDGAQFYRTLRQRDPQAAGRVLFATGGAFSDDLRRFLDSVPNPVLQKPFTAEELCDAIERLLGASRPTATMAPITATAGR